MHDDLHHLCRSSSNRAIKESLFATISNISVKISPSFLTSSLVFLSSIKLYFNYISNIKLYFNFISKIIFYLQRYKFIHCLKISLQYISSAIIWIYVVFIILYAFLIEILDVRNSNYYTTL